MNSKKEWKYKIIIGLVSALIPVVVGLLLLLPSLFTLENINPFVLPKINAVLNTSSSICLIAALIAIKNRYSQIHKKLMLSAFVLSALFLISYILYHAQGIEVKFGDLNGDGITDAHEKLKAGNLRTIYFFILFTHILLSVTVVPLVLLAFYYAFTEQITKHKKIVKWTYPIWLYVTITGVTVYLMISPFYKYVRL